jgi:hypothetical protein
MLSKSIRFVLMIFAAAGATVTVCPPTIAGENVDSRFEGYVYLDTDGRALPFQSDADIEQFLLTATVDSVSKIPVGVTHPRKMLLSKNGIRLNAVFKNIDDEKKMVRDPTSTGRGKLYLTWRDSYVYDVAAYHVDRLLGLERTPPIVIRKLKGSEGSLQIWVEGTITESERREQGLDPPEIARFNQQRTTLQIFDNLLANRDSNLGNTLIDGNWRLWFIDCSRCFGRSPDLLYPEMVTHCERQMWKALKELDRSAAKQALSPYLAEVEIDALLARRDQLVDLIQKRIDERGEDLVLFDQRPPTARAPWAED